MGDTGDVGNEEDMVMVWSGWLSLQFWFWHLVQEALIIVIKWEDPSGSYKRITFLLVCCSRYAFPRNSFIQVGRKSPPWKALFLIGPKVAQEKIVKGTNYHWALVNTKETKEMETELSYFHTPFFSPWFAKLNQYFCPKPASRASFSSHLWLTIPQPWVYSLCGTSVFWPGLTSSQEEDIVKTESHAWKKPGIYIWMLRYHSKRFHRRSWSQKTSSYMNSIRSHCLS